MSHASEASQEQSSSKDHGVTGENTVPKAKSQCSTSSNSSSASRAAARARAKVEAARASAPFVQREAELKLAEARLAAEMKVEEARLAADVKVKEARIMAELSTLKHEKEVAVALAEAEVLEAAAEAEDREGSGSHRDSVHVAMQRTRDYVEQHSKLHLSDTEPPELKPYTPSLLPPVKKEPTPGDDGGASPVLPKSDVAKQPERATPVVRQCTTTDNDNHKAQQPKRLMPAVHHQPPVNPPFAQPDTSSFNRASLQPHVDDRTGMSDITRYLVRRELVNSGLIKFNDRPESYWAWKSSFYNAIGGLNLSASEELDLLTKWLGNQSSEHVIRIRSVHVANPAIGLRRAWDRLEECYGSPEVIERALFERMENFPKISPRDALKLRELGDLLRELESAKSEGYLPGLSYLDTARGVNPIVEKLPHNLQERWLAHGSQYKEQYNVSFPPFAFFTDFICNEARRRNDPSFTLSAVPTVLSNSFHRFSTGPPKLERVERRSGYIKGHVSAHKTEVASQRSTSQSDSSSSKLSDVDRQCPIHKKTSSSKEV